MKEPTPKRSHTSSSVNRTTLFPTRARPQKSAKQSADKTVPQVGVASVSLPLKLALTEEKSHDLCNTFINLDAQCIRYYRMDEVVWYALGLPIKGMHEVDCICFWPAIIEIVTSMPETFRQSPGQDNAGSQGGTSSKANSKWVLRTVAKYRIKLLAVANHCFASNDDLLPYLSYTPPQSLLESIRTTLSPSALEDRFRGLAGTAALESEYNPCKPRDSNSSFDDAIAPYALALQIAGQIADYWSFSDECDELANPLSTSSSQTLAAKAYSTIEPLLPKHATIGTVSERNARTDPVNETVNKVRYYQRLWWGAERIWLHEFVRLKLTRNQFFPDGNQMVSPPIEALSATKPPKGLRAAEVPITQMKGLFMQIESIFVGDVTDSPVWTVKVSGTIYEIVSNEYKDTDEPVKGATSPLAKGKEREMDISPAGTSQGSPSRQEDNHSSESSLAVSGTAHHLPDSYNGYKFHPILPPGYLCVMPTYYIAGRYYPRLFEHRHMQPTVHHAMSMPKEANAPLWALMGLFSGDYQSMDPDAIGWRRSRAAILKDADAEVRQSLAQKIDKQSAASVQDLEMDCADLSETSKTTGDDDDSPSELLIW